MTSDNTPAPTVLVAEDDPMVMGLVREVLRADGYTILEAPDGVEALKMLEGRDPPVDVLLADVMMPHMGGRELLRRAAVSSPSTKLALMSGYVSDSLAREGVAGDVPFLRKPFKPETLVAVVHSLLRQNP